jgi:hypothetical protein
MLAAETEQTNPDAITYIREDVALAMVAAHGEQAQRECIAVEADLLFASVTYKSGYRDGALWSRDAISKLTPDDAKAALGRLIQAEREACARVAETEGVGPETNTNQPEDSWYSHGRRIAAAIKNRSNPND